jgi:hypothetical protein
MSSLADALGRNVSNVVAAQWLRGLAGDENVVSRIINDNGVMRWLLKLAAGSDAEVKAGAAKVLISLRGSGDSKDAISPFKAALLSNVDGCVAAIPNLLSIELMGSTAASGGEVKISLREEFCGVAKILADRLARGGTFAFPFSAVGHLRGADRFQIAKATFGDPAAVVKKDAWSRSLSRELRLLSGVMRSGDKSKAESAKLLDICAAIDGGLSLFVAEDGKWRDRSVLFPTHIVDGLFDFAAKSNNSTKLRKGVLAKAAAFVAAYCGADQNAAARAERIGATLDLLAKRSNAGDGESIADGFFNEIAWRFIGCGDGKWTIDDAGLKSFRAALNGNKVKSTAGKELARQALAAFKSYDRDAGQTKRVLDLANELRGLLNSAKGSIGESGYRTHFGELQRCVEGWYLHRHDGCCDGGAICGLTHMIARFTHTDGISAQGSFEHCKHVPIELERGIVKCATALLDCFGYRPAGAKGAKDSYGHYGIFAPAYLAYLEVRNGIAELAKKNPSLARKDAIAAAGKLVYEAAEKYKSSDVKAFTGNYSSCLLRLVFDNLESLLLPFGPFSAVNVADDRASLAIACVSPKRKAGDWLGPSVAMVVARFSEMQTARSCLLAALEGEETDYEKVFEAYKSAVFVDGRVHQECEKVFLSTIYDLNSWGCEKIDKIIRKAALCNKNPDKLLAAFTAPPWDSAAGSEFKDVVVEALVSICELRPIEEVLRKAAGGEKVDVSAARGTISNFVFKTFKHSGFRLLCKGRFELLRDRVEGLLLEMKDRVSGSNGSAGYVELLGLLDGHDWPYDGYGPRYDSILASMVKYIANCGNFDCVTELINGKLKGGAADFQSEVARDAFLAAVRFGGKVDEDLAEKLRLWLKEVSLEKMTDDCAAILNGAAAGMRAALEGLDDSEKNAGVIRLIGDLAHDEQVREKRAEIKAATEAIYKWLGDKARDGGGGGVDVVCKAVEGAIVGAKGEVCDGCADQIRVYLGNSCHGVGPRAKENVKALCEALSDKWGAIFDFDLLPCAADGARAIVALKSTIDDDMADANKRDAAFAACGRALRSDGSYFGASRAEQLFRKICELLKEYVAKGLPLNAMLGVGKFIASIEGRFCKSGSYEIVATRRAMIGRAVSLAMDSGASDGDAIAACKDLAAMGKAGDCDYGEDILRELSVFLGKIRDGEDLSGAERLKVIVDALGECVDGDIKLKSRRKSLLDDTERVLKKIVQQMYFRSLETALEGDWPLDGDALHSQFTAAIARDADHFWSVAEMWLSQKPRVDTFLKSPPGQNARLDVICDALRKVAAETGYDVSKCDVLYGCLYGRYAKSAKTTLEQLIKEGVGGNVDDLCARYKSVLERFLMGASGDVLARAIEDISADVCSTGLELSSDGIGAHCRLLVTAFDVLSAAKAKVTALGGDVESASWLRLKEYDKLTDGIVKFLPKMASEAIVAAIKPVSLIGKWVLPEENADFTNVALSIKRMTECGANFLTITSIEKALREKTKGEEYVASLLPSAVIGNFSNRNELMCAIIERIILIQSVTLKGLPACAGDETYLRRLGELLVDAFRNVPEESYTNSVARMCKKEDEASVNAALESATDYFSSCFRGGASDGSASAWPHLPLHRFDGKETGCENVDPKHKTDPICASWGFFCKKTRELDGALIPKLYALIAKEAAAAPIDRYKFCGRMLDAMERHIAPLYAGMDDFKEITSADIELHIKTKKIPEGREAAFKPILLAIDKGSYAISYIEECVGFRDAMEAVRARMRMMLEEVEGDAAKGKAIETIIGILRKDNSHSDYVADVKAVRGAIDVVTERGGCDGAHGHSELEDSLLAVRRDALILKVRKFLAQNTVYCEPLKALHAAMASGGRYELSKYCGVRAYDLQDDVLAKLNGIIDANVKLIKEVVCKKTFDLDDAKFVSARLWLVTARGGNFDRQFVGRFCKHIDSKWLKAAGFRGAMNLLGEVSRCMAHDKVEGKELYADTASRIARAAFGHVCGGGCGIWKIFDAHWGFERGDNSSGWRSIASADVRSDDEVRRNCVPGSSGHLDLAMARAGGEMYERISKVMDRIRLQVHQNVAYIVEDAAVSYFEGEWIRLLHLGVRNEEERKFINTLMLNLVADGKLPRGLLAHAVRLNFNDKKCRADVKMEESKAIETIRGVLACDSQKEHCYYEDLEWEAVGAISAIIRPNDANISARAERMGILAAELAGQGGVVSREGRIALYRAMCRFDGEYPDTRHWMAIGGYDLKKLLLDKIREDVAGRVGQIEQMLCRIHSDKDSVEPELKSSLCHAFLEATTVGGYGVDPLLVEIFDSLVKELLEKNLPLRCEGITPKSDDSAAWLARANILLKGVIYSCVNPEYKLGDPACEHWGYGYWRYGGRQLFLSTAECVVEHIFLYEIKKADCVSHADTPIVCADLSPSRVQPEEGGDIYELFKNAIDAVLFDGKRPRPINDVWIDGLSRENVLNADRFSLHIIMLWLKRYIDGYANGSAVRKQFVYSLVMNLAEKDMRLIRIGEYAARLATSISMKVSKKLSDACKSEVVDVDSSNRGHEGWRCMILRRTKCDFNQNWRQKISRKWCEPWRFDLPPW